MEILNVLSSIFGKVLDLITLNRYADFLITSDLQFGFKAKRSTNMCTMVLKEAIDYYTSNSSSVFCTLLDATKAFDRVDYCKLFRSLMKGSPSHSVAFVIKYVYKTGDPSLLERSVFLSFTLSNGVKQGGILSPILFCTYIDSLLYSLAESGVGCFIGRLFVGALVYADDIVLLSPTAFGMRTLLHLCDVFANDFSVVFNAVTTNLNKVIVVHS